MDIFVQQVMSGLATGGIYASLALALVMIYQATDVVNFAQGEMAMFATYLSWSMLNAGMPYWGAFIATLVAVCVAAIAGAVVTVLWEEISTSLRTQFVGPASAVLLWLVATVFIWRETSAERAARLGATGRDSVVCPTCGYNLTGLSEPRCPECGSRFTLDQLLAAQPARAGAELVE